MAKILVTGGAGFIGSHIVDLLQAEGHLVSVVDDLSSGRLENLPSDIDFHKLDVRSADFRSLITSQKFECIVHAAAQISVRASMSDPVLDVSVNVGSLANILSAVHTDYSPFIVFISTGGAIYGEQEKFPADESHSIRPTSVYGLSKYCSELYLDLWRREFGLKFCALRLANVYGPRQNAHGEAGVVAIFSERLLANQPVTINGNGEQTRDFVFVLDVASAVTTVVKQKMTGTFNIGTGIETSVNRIYTLMSQKLGISASATHGPAKPGEQLRSSIDHGLAKKTFGFNPKVTLEQGIGLTVGWFKDQFNQKSSR